ncbi:hypothetical protein [Brevibacterium album]|uniref:hypothetical protein n=1 Tax=Brevibacterium album TaxID=417948 RepID=UPI00055043CD|nr:hypothetical protein [Brevibacterium album]
MSNATTFDHFTVETIELMHAPEGRDWGFHHWRFTVTAHESGAVHVGVYSAGSHRPGATILHGDILWSLGMDAPSALAGEGDLRSTLEALDSEGLGYGLAQGYDVALKLCDLHAFMEALTDDERDALMDEES